VLGSVLNIKVECELRYYYDRSKDAINILGIQINHRIFNKHVAVRLICRFLKLTGGSAGGDRTYASL
jgi:hypothetical protein